MENWAAVAARGLLGKRGLPELDLRALTAMCGEFTGGKDVLHAALIESEPRLSGSDSPRSLGTAPLSPLIRRVATGRSDRSSISLTAFWPSWQCIACYSWRPRLPHRWTEQPQTTANTQKVTYIDARATATAVRCDCCNSVHCYALDRAMPSRADWDRLGATTSYQCCHKLIR